MPAIIPPVGSGILTTQDGFTELLSIGPSRQIRSLQFAIGSTLAQPCIYQLATLDESNAPHWDPGCIFYGFPGIGGFEALVYGIRFKSALPGVPTDIVAQVFFNGDPVPIAFGGSASATGGGGGGTSGITEIESLDGSVTVTDPTGPVTDLSVNFPGGGITDLTSTDGSVAVTDPTGPTTDLAVVMPHEQLSSASLTIAAGLNGLFSWTDLGGLLVDLTNPTDPLILTDGVYAITVVTLLNPAPTAPTLSYARISIGSPSTFAMDTVGFEGGGGPSEDTLTWIGFLAAGQDIAVQVTNDDATGSKTYLGFMYITKLAST